MLLFYTKCISVWNTDTIIGHPSLKIEIIYGSNFNLNECFHHLKIVFQTNISMSIPREKLKPPFRINDSKRLLL